MSETANAMRRPNIPANLKNLPPLADTVKKPIVQEVVAKPEPAPQPPPPPPVAQAPVAQLSEGSEAVTEIPLIQAGTYLSVGTKENGFVEFDLMSHREKGNEVRYLSIQAHGFAMSESEKEKRSSAYMSIISKDEFEKVKAFFSTLKWED